MQSGPSLAQTAPEYGHAAAAAPIDAALEAAGSRASRTMSATSATNRTSRSASTAVGTSSRWGPLRCGKKIVFSPARCAARSFCLTPPMGSTRPFNVTSPVIPTSDRTGRPVRSDVGMTGEVTLNGRVLPIGGVKQKLLAAHRAGLKTIFLPQRNGPHLDDVPTAVLADLDVRLVADVADIVREALEPAASSAASAGAAAAA